MSRVAVYNVAANLDYPATVLEATGLFLGEKRQWTSML
jgi:hypothetical protein